LFDLSTDPTEHFDLAATATGPAANASVAAALVELRARLAAFNRTVFQSPFDDSPVTAAECASPRVQAMLRTGVWAPWQL